MTFVALTILGLLVGGFGTLIGAGGGFLLVPILVFLYPHDEPETLTSISLIVVFFNALSGSIGYFRQRLVDLRAGLLFSAAAVPCAVAGAQVTTMINRTAFELILGAMLLTGATMLFLRSAPHAKHHPPASRFGPRHHYNRTLGTLIAGGVGFVSSLLGIGGGIIHVPSMVHALGFPVHVAAATSHFVLAITAAAAIATHAATGSLTHGVHRAIPIALGAVVGAQIGARLAKHVKPRLILGALAVALVLVGLRILWSGIGDLRARGALPSRASAPPAAAPGGTPSPPADAKPGA